MSFISATEAQARLRKLQMEGDRDGLPSTEILQRQIDQLAFLLTTQPNTPTPTRQGILQMIRNGDLNHSVDTWFNTTQTVANQLHECANVYAYPPLAPIKINDAAITATDQTLTSASNLFMAAMVGRFVHVEGAGTAGATLVTTIASFTSPGSVELTAPAITTVSGAVATINLQKLGHLNTKNNVGTVNDALKATTHSNYASNIQDPDWDKPNGVARIGSNSIVGHTLGHFADNGTTYVALHQLFSGREPYARFNIARKSQYVYSPGRLFVGIYNNNEAVLDWVRANAFTLESIVDGSPTSTISTEYFVVIETDLGYTLVSDVVTIVNAPTDTGYSQGARVRLRWQYFAGTRQTSVYRKRLGGNVFRMETFATGSNQWTDVNRSNAVDTGTTVFPIIADSVNRIPAYWSDTFLGLTEVTVDGAPGEFWQPVEVRMPYPPTINNAAVFDPHLVIGFTEPLSTRVLDGVGSGTTLTSAAAQFTAGMVGKTIVVTDPVTEAIVTTTIASFGSSSSIVLTLAPPAGTGLIVEIKDSQPHGLFFDLVGLSLNDGEWDFHQDDNNRPQSVASNPNGSTQGGTTGQPPTQGGGTGTGPGCPRVDQWVPVEGEVGEVTIKRAGELSLADRIYDRILNNFRKIKSLEIIHDERIIKALARQTGAEGYSSNTHPLIADIEDRTGCPVGHIADGSPVLVWHRPTDTLHDDLIADTALQVKYGSVVHIALEDGFIYAYSDDGIWFIICHNNKREPGEQPEFPNQF